MPARPLSRHRKRRLGGRDLGEDPEGRLADRQLVELGVDATEVVEAAPVAALDLDTAHWQRPPLRAHRAEAVAGELGLPDEVEVDLDLEDLLHATEVGVPVVLVRVDERARTLEAGRRVHHLVAVHLAPAALHLVLRMEGQHGRRGRKRTLFHNRILRPLDRAPQDLTSTAKNASHFSRCWLLPRSARTTYARPVGRK